MEAESATTGDDFRWAVRLLVVDLQNLLQEIEPATVPTRKGIDVLFESQLAILQHVDQALEKGPSNQRLRATAQSVVGVLPSLLNSVAKSTKESPLASVSKCRDSVRGVSSHLY